MGARRGLVTGAGFFPTPTIVQASTTATGPLANSYGVGTTSIVILVTSSCLFGASGSASGASDITFATNPETLAVMGVSANNGTSAGEQTLISPTANPYLFGERVTQNVPDCRQDWGRRSAYLGHGKPLRPTCCLARRYRSSRVRWLVGLPAHLDHAK